VSLDNLVGRTLETITPDPASIRKLQAAAERNIIDAKLE